MRVKGTVVFGLILLAFIGAMVYMTLFGGEDGEGYPPRARLVPLIIGLPTLALLLYAIIGEQWLPSIIRRFDVSITDFAPGLEDEELVALTADSTPVGEAKETEDAVAVLTPVGEAKEPFLGAISSGFRKYVDFRGRASRSEYWYWVIFVFASTEIIKFTGVSNLVYLVVGFVTVLPTLAVGVRRLHDTDRSGWWILLMFVPVVGSIVLFIWLVRKGATGENRFIAEPMAKVARLDTQSPTKNQLERLAEEGAEFDQENLAPGHHGEASEAKRVLSLLGWMVGFVVSIVFFGFFICVPLFTFFFLKVAAKASWGTSILVTFFLFDFVWVLFGQYFPAGLFAGWLFDGFVPPL